jgi:hypothetical protein
VVQLCDAWFCCCDASCANIQSATGACVQEYANEDVMVGAWLLGLAVEHTYDASFCCYDTAACGKSTAQKAADHNAHLQQIRERVARGARSTWRRRLAAAGDTKFDALQPGAGPLAVGGVASGGAGARNATQWLAAAAGGGADVATEADSSVGPDAVATGARGVEARWDTWLGGAPADFPATAAAAAAAQGLHSGARRRRALLGEGDPGGHESAAQAARLAAFGGAHWRGRGLLGNGDTKVCAMYAGGCNGPCITQYGKEWEQLRKCVQVLDTEEAQTQSQGESSGDGGQQQVGQDGQGAAQ